MKAPVNSKLLRFISLCTLLCLGIACSPKEELSFGSSLKKAGHSGEAAIASIAHQTTNEDVILNLTFTTSSNVACSDINATSSDTTLLPNNQISITAVGGTCVLLATPAANLSGMTTITLVAQGVTVSFNLTVTPVNDKPTISTTLTARPTLTSDSLNVTVVSGGGADEAAQTFTWSKCQTDNTNVTISCSAIAAGVSTVTLTSVAGTYAGDVTVTLATTDSGGAVGNDQTLTLKKYSKCKTILADYPTAADSDYIIDPDGAGVLTAYAATCDMANGGWMKIIGDSTTVAADLTKFGDVSTITGTFYNDPLYGIGWGTHVATNADWIANVSFCYLIDKIPNYTNVKVKISGVYNTPASSIGSLVISYPGISQFGRLTDGWADPASGHSMTIDGVNVMVNVQSDVSNYQINSPTAGPILRICMTGHYNPAYPYGRRYVQDMWIK